MGQRWRLAASVAEPHLLGFVAAAVGVEVLLAVVAAAVKSETVVQ